MAHFAKLGVNGKVIQVVPFDDDRCKDSNGNEDEEIGRQALEAETGWPLWKQCSYNTHKGSHATEGKTPLRANYPAIGDIYDEENNIFVIPKDSDNGSWTLNTTTGMYEAPTAMPDYEDSMYNDGSNDLKYTLIWNESTKKWEGWSVDKSTKMAIWNGSSWDAV
tara:strand:- start:16 stop:507 length:492 start_codon:yes stop_codon:yes gene_type:complete